MCSLGRISKCSQDAKRSDCFPLSDSCETAFGVLAMGLDSTVQEKHTAVSPVKGQQYQGVKHRRTKRSWKKWICPNGRKEG